MLLDTGVCGVPKDGPKVLAVEDARPVREFLQEILADEGSTILTALAGGRHACRNRCPPTEQQHQHNQCRCRYTER